jgi:vesicle-associated membrane protein 72
LKMGSQALIYSFVARGTVVLAEYTAFSGNFSTIAVQCLQKLPATNNKFTYTCDRHTFNYLVDEGFTYLVVADEEFGREIIFAFLERVKEDFKRRYAGGKADLATAHSLDKDYGPKLRDHMQFCVDHPEEMNKISKIKSQVAEVKGIMMDNIEKVLDRGTQIELLVDRTDQLRDQADTFQRTGRKLRRKMWFQNMKVKLIVLAIIIVIAIIIWLSICKGFVCHSSSSSTKAQSPASRRLLMYVPAEMLN